MRAEKEPSTGSRERCVVEIQLRDAQREQDSATANSKHKEEKKEIFTKVGDQSALMGPDGGFSTTDSAPGEPQEAGSSHRTGLPG